MSRWFKLVRGMATIQTVMKVMQEMEPRILFRRPPAIQGWLE